jgi:hypothetical protein
MKTVIYLGFAITLSIAGSACSSGANNGPASQETPAPEAQAAPVSDTNRLRTFVPPSDGKLSASHVEAYIAVRRRALEIVKDESKDSSPLSLLAKVPAAEARASGELRRDVDEYRWVQARIAEASAPELPEGSASILKAIEASAIKRSAELQKAAAEERRIPTPAAPDPSVVAFNRSVLDPFRTELATVDKS